ncbi:MAG: DUF481 domain-containing protein [Acidobacteriota bacterium]
MKLQVPEFPTLLLPILVFALCGCLPARAREKSDLLVLKNGNSVHGEIVRLQRGLLTCKTASMGTLEIKWEDLAQISSNFQFAVEDTNGQLFVGRIEVGEEPESIHVVGRRPVRNLKHLSIVEIREARQDLLQRFSGAVELGYTFTKASERQQFTLYSDLRYRAERYEGTFSFDSILSSSKKPEDTERNTDIDRKVVAFGGNRNLTGKWLIFSQGRSEHNLELELDRRWSFLGGPLYIAHRTNRAEFAVRGGLSYTRERYFDEEGVNNAEIVAGANAQFFKLYTPKVDFIVDFLLLPTVLTANPRRQRQPRMITGSLPASAGPSTDSGGSHENFRMEQKCLQSDGFQAQDRRLPDCRLFRSGSSFCLDCDSPGPGSVRRTGNRWRVRGDRIGGCRSACIPG